MKETDSGIIAVQDQNPRLILSAILVTHLADNRLGAEHNLYKLEQTFAKYSMKPGDSISSYHQRFRASLSGVQEAYSRAKIDVPDSSSYREVLKVYDGTEFVIQCLQAALRGQVEGLARHIIGCFLRSFEV